MIVMFLIVDSEIVTYVLTLVDLIILINVTIIFAQFRTTQVSRILSGGYKSKHFLNKGSVPIRRRKSIARHETAPSFKYFPFKYVATFFHAK